MADVILCPHCLSRVEAGKEQCPFCDKSLRNTNPPPGTLPYASLLAGRYTVGRHVSTDGEGVVYAALENNGGVRVVLKEYFPVTLSEGRDSAGAILPKEGKEVLFKTTRMDFADLHRSIMRITPTTGLAAVLDVVEANNTVYVVLEQVGGESLSHYLSEHPGGVSAAQARSMMQPVMEGVAALHKAGLVHRGISPENILLTGGAARLCGYGTLGLRTEGSELKSQLYEGYSAPEQYSAAEFEGRYTDVYGLAAVFYRLVAGQAPVSARQRLVSDSLPSAQQLEPSVPGHVSAVLEHALEMDPAQRIQNVPELMGSLMSARAAESLNQSRREWAVSGKSLLAGSLVVIAVLFALLLWSILGRDSAVTTPESASQPASSAAPESVLVPDFTGYTYSQLQSDPQFSANYRFAITAQEYSSDHAQGVVIDQSPEAGTTTTEGQPLIELVISKGPEKVEMPNIIGFTRESAEKELAANNIKASFFMIENNGDYASDCVVRTDVEAGEFIDVNEVTVNVYIAKERVVINPPEPTPEPTPAPSPSAQPGA
ncbi:protein kinase domain-containing protein [Candidatus Allofournierella merdipullorum]|uniref:protein kinase domain-containing protein n=1 Tax=Candidatus Allofournierella merdipullorum TaxID=2838595 RepID=UPI003AB3EADB